MLAKRFNVLPFDKRLLDLTTEQVVCIFEHLRDESKEGEKIERYEDDEFDKWVEEVSEGRGWVSYYEDRFDEIEIE